MKLKFARKPDNSAWEEWFAWHPVIITRGISWTGCLIVWLGKVERRRLMGEWQYQPLPEDRDFWK